MQLTFEAVLTKKLVELTSTRQERFRQLTDPDGPDIQHVRPIRDEIRERVRTLLANLPRTRPSFGPQIVLLRRCGIATTSATNAKAPMKPRKASVVVSSPHSGATIPAMRVGTLSEA